MSVIRPSLARRDGEGGAVLVFTALLMLVMMGFAAIAVDAASAWSEKREVQTAADMGSLAAINEIPRTLLADAVANSASVGADFVTRNADATPSVGEPTAGPSCNARPPGFTRPCITNVAVDADGSSDNSFAPAIGGASAIDVPASAEAQIDIEYPAMKLFPIGVNSTGGRRLRCAAQGPPLPGPPPVPQCAIIPFSAPFPDPLPDPLPNPVALGSTDVRFLGFRRLDLGCDDSEASPTTNRNLAMGVDHLVDNDMTQPVMADIPACEAGHELSLPNTFSLIGSPTVGTAGIRGLLGGPELWDYLTPASSGFCHPIFFGNLVHPDPAVLFTLKTVLLDICLQGGGNPVFSFPSGGLARLGWAIDQSGTRVQGFTPVWIHSLVDGFMTPQSTSPNGFAVVVLSASWLPANLTEVDPGGMDNLTFKLVS